MGEVCPHRRITCLRASMEPQDVGPLIMESLIRKETYLSAE